ncbi:hypothetical protein VTK26DRAFT_8153 [Humicola hyalothermophila]
MAYSCLGPRPTAFPDQPRAAAVTGRPGVRFTSSTLIIEVDCCQSRGQSLGSESRTAPSNAASSPPSQTNAPLTSSASTGRPLHPAAIVAIITGATLLAFSTTCLVFVLRRRALRRQRATRMYAYPEGYRSVAPDTPTTRSPSPTMLSSLSSPALQDLGFDGGDDHELEPPTHSQFHAADRRSVDTIFALRYYYSQEQTCDCWSPGPFIAELPGTPPPSRPAPVPSPRSTPTPPPTTAPASPPAPTRIPPSPPKGARTRKQGRIYLNPAGEPWVSVPPPNIPLPPTPPGPPPSSTRSPPSRAYPRFSLFPPPANLFPNAMTAPARRQNQNQGQSPNRDRDQQPQSETQENHSLPAPNRPSPLLTRPSPPSPLLQVLEVRTPTPSPSLKRKPVRGGGLAAITPHHGHGGNVSSSFPLPPPPPASAPPTCLFAPATTTSTAITTSSRNTGTRGGSSWNPGSSSPWLSSTSSPPSSSSPSSAGPPHEQAGQAVNGGNEGGAGRRRGRRTRSLPGRWWAGGYGVIGIPWRGKGAGRGRSV